MCAAGVCARCAPDRASLVFVEFGVRRESSRLRARVDELFVNDDVELAYLALLDVNRPAPASFKPGLRTEGFWFVASMRAIKNPDRHDRCLLRGNLAQPQAGSLSAPHVRLQCRCRRWPDARKSCADVHYSPSRKRIICRRSRFVGRPLRSPHTLPCALRSAICALRRARLSSCSS